MTNIKILYFLVKTLPCLKKRYIYIYISKSTFLKKKRKQNRNNTNLKKNCIEKILIMSLIYKTINQ